jgi:uncharacterized protein DUF3630
MNTKLYEDEKFINLELSDDSNWLVFELIARELTDRFKVQWKIQADGLDQRYWDFEINGIVLTLHLEHYLGIVIFADKRKTDSNKARIILQELENHFNTWNPIT